MATDYQIAHEIHDELTHGCDGPVTAYVLLCRATRLASAGKHDTDTIADMLYGSLVEYGYMPDHEAERTGYAFNTAD